jgi:retron-type reverse transcriptase
MFNEKNVTQTIRQLLEYNQEKRCTNAFLVMSDPRILRLAYETIKSNPGNMVKGTDHLTLDGLSEEWFQTTSKELIHETYRPKAARRIYIPKAARCSPAYRCGAANGKMRPLGISSPRDKIVQQAMKMTMEIVLEPRFLDCSHGFRPKRGCHSALKEIRK